jgi:hypothetical protein
LKAGDKVLVKDDYIADLYDEGPCQVYVELLAGSIGIIDHFSYDEDGLQVACICFFDHYYIEATMDEFDLDGIFMVNFSSIQRDLAMDDMKPMLTLIKDKEQ